MAIVQLWVPAWVDFFLLYIFCDFGTQVTQRFEDIANDVYNLQWYLLSLDMQMNLLTMITLGQKNVYIRGSGGIRCTRDTFKQVYREFRTMQFEMICLI